MRRFLLVSFAIGLSATRLSAQQPAPPKVEVADRIVAVVGDSIVLKSDVDLEMSPMRSVDKPLADSAAIFKRIVERRVGELVMLQAASRDTSLHVTQDQIDSDVQKEIESRRRQFASDEQYRAALQQAGMTEDELRRSISQEVGGRILLREFVQKMSKDRHAPPVTDADIRKYFEANKATFGVRPATITFAQVVIAPKWSDTAKATARKKAEEALDKLKQGADFETIAKQYSEDPGTREKGGDLGWFRSGSMVREFNDVVFAMQPGQISNIVESPFGYHIIKLEKVKGAERQARHILIIPTVTPEDVQHTREYATQIVEQVRAGANVDSLQKAIGDPNEQARIGPFPQERLPDPYGAALATATAGSVVGPLELPGTTGTSKFAVVKVLETRPAGEYSLDDPQFRNDLKQTLEQNTLVDELIRDLSKKTLVEYRLDQ